jgi:hypothetical protein
MCSYEFPRGTTLSAAWGRYSYFFQINPRIFTSNMDLAKLGRELKPEKALHRVAGIEQKLDLWTVKIEGFMNHFYDQPEQYPHYDREGNLRQGLNSGETKTRGLEVMLRKDRLEDAGGPYGWISYTYTRADYRSGLPTEPGYLGVPSNPAGDEYGDRWIASGLEQRHNVKMSAGYIYGGSTLGLRAEYYTSFPYTPIVGSEYDTSYNMIYGDDRYVPVYGEKHSSHFPPFFSVDVRYSYKRHYSWGYVSWYVEVINANNDQPVSREEFDRSEPYREGENPVQEAPEGAIINFFPGFGVEVKF